MTSLPFELSAYDLELTVASGTAAEANTDALVLGAWAVGGKAQLADAGLPSEATESITKALTTLKATGKIDSTTVLAGAAGTVVTPSGLAALTVALMADRLRPGGILHAALAQADRVVVLVDGEVADAGPWRDLAARWRHLAG